MYGFMRRTHKMQLLHMHPVFIPRNLKLCHFLFADTVNPEWVGVACLPTSVLTCVTSDSQRLFSSRVHLIPVPFLSFLFYFCPSTPGFWNWVTWGRGWNLPLHFNNTLHHQYSTMVLCKQTCCGFYRRFNAASSLGRCCISCVGCGQLSCHRMEFEKQR